MHAQPMLESGKTIGSGDEVVTILDVSDTSGQTVIVGDTVYFENLTTHNAVQVTEETYYSNGTESIPNGFELNSDDFIVFPDEDTYYYVCTPHVEMGMKGKSSRKNGEIWAAWRLPDLPVSQCFIS